MKIYIPNVDLNKIGGGWTFTRNFIDLASEYMVDNIHDADIMFVTGATLVKRLEIDFAKKYNKKVVLRVDGIPEDWRNRGTGWSRLRDFGQLADLVVFQSHFTQKTTGRLIGRASDGVVIYNGVDTRTFHENSAMDIRSLHRDVLYINYRKGENNKRVEEVIERFRIHKLDHVKDTITFVGNYPKKQFLWDGKNWDFGLLDQEKGTDWLYVGIISDRVELATIMRGHKYIAFPSFADPCPNTLIEAMSCGCEPLWLNDYGGQHDIVTMWKNIDWSRERMVSEYLDAFSSIL